VPLAQLLTEVLCGEVGILLSVQPTHALQFALRRPPPAHPTKPAIPQAVHTVHLVAAAHPAKMPG
jgi:hypothetical protein